MKFKVVKRLASLLVDDHQLDLWEMKVRLGVSLNVWLYVSIYCTALLTNTDDRMRDILLHH